MADNINWTRNRHTAKFGVDIRRYIAPQRFIQRERGDYNYSTLERYLLDLNPDVLAERNVGGAPYWGNQNNFSWFAQDDVRVHSNLTLNLGVRYEFKSVPAGDKLQKLNAISSVPGLIDFREPRSQKANFAPRIGLAYSPGASGRTSIRAGFGMAYDKYFDNLGTLSKPPQIESTVDVPLATDIPNFLANGGIRPNARGQGFADAAEARANTSTYIVDQLLPYSIQWNLGVQHVFGQNYTVEVRYLGTRGVHLPTQDRENVLSPVDGTHYLPTYFQAPSTATLAGLPFTLADLKASEPLRSASGRCRL